MMYLIASLALLVLTPFFAQVLPGMRPKLQTLGSWLLVAVGFGLAFHVFFEHRAEDLDWLGFASFLAGFALFSVSETKILRQTRGADRGSFICLLVFVACHATADGFALTQGYQDAAFTLGGLQIGILIHRLAFEAVLWGFAEERYGFRSALAVLSAIFSGTIAGYALGDSLVRSSPQIFELFEFFMAGAFFHIGIDALREVVAAVQPKQLSGFEELRELSSRQRSTPREILKPSQCSNSW